MHHRKDVTLTVEEKPPHDHDHDHDHHDEKEEVTKEKAAERSNRIRLLSMLTMTFGFFLVEIIVGYMTGSVALVADSFHMLSDVIALVIAYAAVRMSPKKWSKNTFGYARAEVLGALVNAVFLVALCFTILAESLERFIDIKDIKEPKLILIVGTIGLLVNLVGLGLFHEHGHSHGGGGHGHSHGGGGGGHGHSHGGGGHGHSHNSKDNKQEIHHGLDIDDKHKKIDLVSWVPTTVDVNGDQKNDLGDEKSKTAGTTGSAAQMNMHGVFLHVLADALGSVIVIISALVIWLSDWEYRMYVDPTLSVLMVMLILASVWPLLTSSAMVLLQTVPTHIEIEDLRRRLLKNVKGTEEVHEFHIWQLSGNRIIASAHILCSSDNQADSMRIGEEVKEFFHREGIHSTTIQLEFANYQLSSGENSDIDSESDISTTRSDCYLTCPNEEENEDCYSNSCCRIKKRKNVIVNNAKNTDNHSHNHDHPHDHHHHDHDHDHSNSGTIITNTNTAFVPDAEDAPGVIEVHNENTDCCSSENHSRSHSHSHAH